MSNYFNSVENADALDELLSRSHQEPVLLFKHSTMCPVSAAAYREMKNLDGEVSLVVVQKARAVSNEVEARTGVQHETPQAIILRNGQAVWSASHWRITAEAVEQALRENK
ncbi:MAG TPA: bacillithiol system redox-active protein YtxJ [Pyrinomonadaceae bacterium]|nr:bacillithiol system redox-active protein YtxJ [Pyrinomonadaceae bacterium]